jgi:hypothetical protein
MAKGKRISEQRRSARRTLDARRRGENRASEGSKFRGSSSADRARENRQDAIDRDRQKRETQQKAAQEAARKAAAEAARKAAEEAKKKANVKQAQEEQASRLAAGVSPEQQQANLEGFQEGFTDETVTEAFGDVAGSVTGGLGKTVVEGISKAADFFGEGDTDEGDTFQRRGFQRFGQQVAEDIGLTDSGIANTALDIAAKSHPVSALGKAALDFNKRANTTITGPGGVDRPAFTKEPGAGPGGRRGRGEDINPDRSDSGFNATLTPAPTPPTTLITPSTPKVSVAAANPGIGISSGTDERVPNFTGSIVVSGRKSRKRRGIT